MTDDLKHEKAKAAAWFGELRDQIVASFEALEEGLSTGPTAGMAAGRFERTETSRTAEDGPRV